MAPSGGNRQPTTTCYVTVLFSLLLFLVPSHRLCVTGQWDCPNSDGFYSCWYVDGRYEIVGGLDGAVDSYQAIPPIDMASVASSSTTGTLYRSYTLRSGITVANVQTSAFSEFRVSELLLDGHGIKTLDPLAFSGIGSELSQLILDNNTISQLPVSIFSSLSSIELISLSSNKLVSLESGIFDARLSSKLRWLRLSDNQLSSILDGTFGNLTSLMGLWLDGNQLTSVSSGLLRGLVSLTWLDLSGNSITSISSTAFTDLSSIERLRLQDNRLVQLDAGLIASNPSLELFDISNNLLTTLPVNDLQYWNTSRFVYLGLSGNAWNCDCSLVTWTLERATTIGVSYAACTTPSDASGKSVMCYKAANCAALENLVQPASCATIVEPTSTAPQTKTTSASGGINVGVVAGVIAGVVVLVAIVVVIIGVLVYNRRQRIRREKNVTNFIGSADDANDGADSTAQLVYRLGGTRRFAGNPMFDTNAKTIQATATAKGGATGGGASDASAEPSGATNDGNAAAGEEDVSVAVKPGMKVVMNTNVTSSGWQTGQLPPRVMPDSPPEYPGDEEDTKC